MEAECLMWTQRLHLGPPCCPGEAPDALEHLLAPSCLSTSVAGPEHRQTLSQEARLWGPQLFPTT